MTEEAPRAGRVAIVGRPNVGKSTLLNALLGQKLAIVTDRPGTTRTTLLGVHETSTPPTQIAFVDTPGLERPKSVVGRVLVEEAHGALEGADAVLLLVDATKKGPAGDPAAPDDVAIFERARSVGRPIVVALNKVDLLKDKRALLPKLAAWSERFQPAALVPLSALKHDNLDPLIQELRGQLPEGTLYPTDFVTDRPIRFFAAEFVREAALRHTRQEVPYAIAVRIDQFREEDAHTRIDATIVVDKPSHKGIVIGAQGSRIKTIGTEARIAIEELVQRKVVLKLWVRVEEDWTRDPEQARRNTQETDA